MYSISVTLKIAILICPELQKNDSDLFRQSRRLRLRKNREYLLSSLGGLFDTWAGWIVLWVTHVYARKHMNHICMLLCYYDYMICYYDMI